MTDRGPFIFTNSGRKYHFLDPQPQDIVFSDIAHSLSNLCRYTGQGKFYSVAEHSVHVMNLYALRHHQAPLQELRSALLHDATEAYCGDVSKPLKTLLPAYDTIEERAAQAIAKRFAVDCSTARIKECDLIMLATELPVIINYTVATDGAFAWLPPPCTIEPACLAPEYAKALFLRTAESVGLHAV